MTNWHATFINFCLHKIRLVLIKIMITSSQGITTLCNILHRRLQFIHPYVHIWYHLFHILSSKGKSVSPSRTCKRCAVSSFNDDHRIFELYSAGMMQNSNYKFDFDLLTPYGHSSVHMQHNHYCTWCKANDGGAIVWKQF